MDGIIWDGSKQFFTKSHLDAAEAFSDNYWNIMGLFIQNIQSYKGGWRFAIHHIDRDHANNHPSNLMLMTHSAHSTLHGRLESKERWARLNPEDYETWCDKISRGTKYGMANMSVGSKRSMCENIKEGMANMSSEAKAARSEAMSKAHASSKYYIAQEFIRTQTGYTTKEFMSATGYAYTMAYNLLRAHVISGSLTINKKGHHNIYLYGDLNASK